MVAVMGNIVIAVKGKSNIGYQQQITDIVERKNTEDDIVESTHCNKSTEIEHGIIARRQ
jgi:hypothetical protein